MVAFFAIFLILCIKLNAQGDNLNNVLSNLSTDAAKAYVRPAVSGFGADLNSGWMHKIVPGDRFALDIELTVVGIGTYFNNTNSNTFSTSGFFRFNRDQAAILTANVSDQNARNAIINQIISQDFQVGISGPTIIGSKNQHVMVSFPGQTFTYNSQSFVVPT
jgi:hypothetical protein